jgi:hypothetical protein
LNAASQVTPNPWNQMPTSSPASARFGAAEAAEQLGVPIVGGSGRHHTVAALVADGYQVITF